MTDPDAALVEQVRHVLDAAGKAAPQQHDDSHAALDTLVERLEAAERNVEVLTQRGDNNWQFSENWRKRAEAAETENARLTHVIRDHWSPEQADALLTEIADYPPSEAKC